MRGWSLTALVCLTALAGCLDDEPPLAADAAAPEVVLGDPLDVGALDVARSEWDLGDRVVQGDGGAYVVRVHGSVHAPDGDGPHPVLVFMHGRHGTCATFVGERLLQPCPDLDPVTDPVDSYQGYDYLSENLASHGLVVLSVDANNVNDRDNDMGAAGDDYGATARGRIVMDVLAALRAAQDGAGTGGLEGLEGRLDLSRVGLMGHSRGGEGVARAWELARDEGALPDGVAIAAVLALAPSDFDRQDVRGVPFGTILPYCDGDVYNLQGGWMYDDARDGNTAPMHQFLTMGANHNYYNTVWTRSDWGTRDDPWCDEDTPTSGRDSPEAQRLHGVAVMGAFFRHYVGGEADLMPYLTGEETWPVPGVVTSYHPAEAMQVIDAGRPGGGAQSAGVQVSSCAGRDCPAHNTFTIARQDAIEWDGPGVYRVAVLPGRDITFRIGLDPETITEAELDDISVVVVRGAPDSDPAAPTTTIPLRDLGVRIPPGGQSGAKTVLSTVRLDLPDDAGEVQLVFGPGDGFVQTNDWLYV